MMNSFKIMFWQSWEREREERERERRQLSAVLLFCELLQVFLPIKKFIPQMQNMLMIMILLINIISLLYS